MKLLLQQSRYDLIVANISITVYYLYSSTADFPKWDEVEVCAISVPAKKDYAQQHGVFWIGEDVSESDLPQTRAPSESTSFNIVLFCTSRVLSRTLSTAVHLPPSPNAVYPMALSPWWQELSFSATRWQSNFLHSMLCLLSMPALIWGLIAEPNQSRCQS